MKKILFMFAIKFGWIVAGTLIIVEVSKSEDISQATVITAALALTLAFGMALGFFTLTDIKTRRRK